MMAFTVYILAVLLLSSAVTYIVWCHVRNDFLRQEIFNVRDDLFDDATQLGFLDEPLYTECRTQLNSLASKTDYITTALIVRSLVLARTTSLPVNPLEEAAPEHVRLRVQLAHMTIGMTVYRHLLYRTLSGWVFFLICFMANSTRSAESRVTEMFARDLGLVTHNRATPPKPC